MNSGIKWQPKQWNQPWNWAMEQMVNSSNETKPWNRAMWLNDRSEWWNELWNQVVESALGSAVESDGVIEWWNREMESEVESNSEIELWNQMIELSDGTNGGIKWLNWRVELIECISNHLIVSMVESTVDSTMTSMAGIHSRIEQRNGAMDWNSGIYAGTMQLSEVWTWAMGWMVKWSNGMNGWIEWGNWAIELMVELAVEVSENVRWNQLCNQVWEPKMECRMNSNAAKIVGGANGFNDVMQSWIHSGVNGGLTSGIEVQNGMVEWVKHFWLSLPSTCIYAV